MNASRCRTDFVAAYTARAPLALAFERILECKLLAAETIEPPILDLGCGDGLFASVLFDQSIDTGIDPNIRELDHAAKLGIYRELICCYGDVIPKPSDHYQTVISNSVLEHIVDLEPVLREAFRILAPGGAFYFTVPADNFEVWTVGNLVLSGLGLRKMAARYRSRFNRFWKHHHAYSDAQWELVVTKNGFHVKEVSRYDAPRVAVLNDCLIPFAVPALLLKKLTNRWVLSPGWRKLLLWPWLSLFECWLSPVRHSNGCLVFIKAIKP